MFLLFSSGFLSRIQPKKSRGTDIFGLCFVSMTVACTLSLEKLYLDAKSPCVCVYPVYGRKISLRLVQRNLGSVGRKGNYKEGKEISLAIVLLSKLSCC